jgi:hypothetical protein
VLEGLLRSVMVSVTSQLAAATRPCPTSVAGSTVFCYWPSPVTSLIGYPCASVGAMIAAVHLGGAVADAPSAAGSAAPQLGVELTTLQLKHR